MSKKSVRRPSIAMLESEADSLFELAATAEKHSPVIAKLLMEEIARASIHTDASMPNDVVTMFSRVEFENEDSRVRRSIQLVFPKDADISAERISILTPVGAGLIGMREGESIDWPDNNGRTHRLRIVKVSQLASL